MENDLRKHQSAVENQQAKDARKKERAKKEEQNVQERRRRKEERQEKKVERLGEPLTAWMCRTFRVVTVAATLIMSGLEFYNSSMMGASNVMERVCFTALGAWTAFGLIWFVAAAARMISLQKEQGEENDKEYHKYRRNILAALTGFAILLIANLAV